MTTDLLITSDRLTLRPIRLQDSLFLLRYRSNSLDNQYQGWIPKTIHDVHDFITEKVSAEINVPDTWFQLVIISKENNKLIGDLGIHFLKSDPDQVELGYTLDKDFQGKGFASEAITQTINYLFEVLNKQRILACIDPRHEKSIRLIERLGFQKEAFSEESILVSHEYPDDLVYTIRKDAWAGRKKKSR
jgi:RimJ/RimL family protein N-acetyltransferase